MKLNLLPTTVSKQRKAKTAWIWFALMVIAGIGGATAMTITSAAEKKAAHDAVDEVRSQADAVSAKAASADEIIKAAAGVTLNANLARAMVKHNDAYPDLYEMVKKYIPPYYRLNHISAVPASDTSTDAIVTITGTLTTFQQYVDLPLALLQIPGCTSVSPSGFAVDDPFRPGLVQIDQEGKPHKGSVGAVPDDQLERLAYFQSNLKTEGYLGVGNFGSETNAPRGAMPDSSLVTVTLMITNKDIRTPNPRTTLTSGPATTATVPVAGTVATPPTTPPPAATGAKGADADDDMAGLKKGKASGGE